MRRSFFCLNEICRSVPTGFEKVGYCTAEVVGSAFCVGVLAIKLVAGDACTTCPIGLFDSKQLHAEGEC